jgi:hypothetical protein
MGITSYDTEADLPAVTTDDNGTMARVTDDATASNNTFWVVIDGAWEIDTGLVSFLQSYADAAEGFAGDASDAAASVEAAAAQVGVYITLPAPTSALNRLLELNLYTRAAGVDIAWPANMHVRELAASASDQFRFRIGGGDTVTGDGGYPQIAAETSNAAAAGATSGGTLARNYAGLTSEDQLLLYASDTSLGVPKGTVIGTYRIKFDGASFGTYFPFTVFAYAAGGLKRSRILPTAVATANTRAVAEDVLRSEPDDTPFVSTVPDTYMRSIVEDFYVERGVPGRPYVLQYRTRLSGSQRQIGFRLYDTVRETIVAQVGEARTYDWEDDVPESMSLSNATLGSPIGGADYVGVEATVFIKNSEINWTTTDWTTVADPALAGIKPDRVLSKERVRDMIMTGQGIRKKFRTFGTGGDFPTLKAAVDSLFAGRVLASVTDNDPDNVQRASWPFSDICTPSHQWHLKAMPGHTEDYAAPSPAGVGYRRGILCWMGLTIELLADTNIRATYSGDGVYLIDYNLGGRIIMPAGALLRTDDPNNAVVHQDAASALSKPSAANANDKTAGQQFFEIYGLVAGGGTFRSAIFPWSGGTSDGQDIIFDGPVMEVTGSGQNFTTHTSPNNARGGRYTFRNVTLKGGSKTISLVTSNTVAAKHEIVVENSDVTAVSGSAGYVRVGKNADTTYSNMEP